MEAEKYGRDWILEKAVKVLKTYEGTPITIRQLYYRLVSVGMPNNLQAYKRVDKAMTEARWDKVVDMEAFIDRERSMAAETDADEPDLPASIRQGKNQIKAWMGNYSLDSWSNQKNYVEIWVEKKALQGVFEGPARRKNVGLAPCKGYPSITFLHTAAERFIGVARRGKRIVILYFGDHDPSGDDIPRSIQENLSRMGADVEVDRIALTNEQIEEYKLPPAPVKMSDARAAAWDGDGAVELDAIEPNKLVEMANEAIDKYFDEDLYRELKTREDDERRLYKAALVNYVNSGLADDGDDEDDDDDNDEEE